MNYKTIFIFVVSILIVSCTSVPSEFQQLDKTMFAYERALRWQNYDMLIAFHKNQNQNLTQEKRKYLKRFRVTAYDEAYRKINNEALSALQVIEIKYYNDEYAVVRNMTLRNQWEYDKATGHWLLSNPFPEFK